MAWICNKCGHGNLDSWQKCNYCGKIQHRHIIQNRKTLSYIEKMGHEGGEGD